MGILIRETQRGRRIRHCSERKSNVSFISSGQLTPEKEALFAALHDTLAIPNALKTA
jgi:hypothetical protein